MSTILNYRHINEASPVQASCWQNEAWQVFMQINSLEKTQPCSCMSLHA